MVNWFVWRFFLCLFPGGGGGVVVALFGWLVGWLVGSLVVWLVGWLAGWLVVFRYTVLILTLRSSESQLLHEKNLELWSFSFATISR